MLFSTFSQNLKMVRSKGLCGGLEISIPSTLKHETTSCVLITRGTERFVDEIHDHKNELRSSTELLSAFQKSEGKELCVEEEEEEESIRIKETCAHPITSRYGNKEACANNLSNTPSDSLFKKIIIPLRTKESGLLLTLILHTEELCRYKYPKSLQRWYVITIKTNENKMDHVNGTLWDRCC